MISEDEVGFEHVGCHADRQGGPILLRIVSALEQYLSRLAGREVADEGDRHERFAFLQETARHLNQRQDGLQVTLGGIADLSLDHFFMAFAS